MDILVTGCEVLSATKDLDFTLIRYYSEQNSMVYLLLDK